MKALDIYAKAQQSLVVQHSDFSLKTISDMVESKSINVAPHYQRRERWQATKQSALIESFLMNVPVPPVYLSEDDFGKYSVIDGKQRITAIYKFMTNQLKLKDMTIFNSLEGKTFSQLPSEIQNALSIRPYLRIVTLLKQTDPDLKYEVFLRLNTGGEHLNSQEIRNVAYAGPLNNLLYELSEDPIIQERMKITNNTSPNYRNMADLELVLRFLTLMERWDCMKTSLLSNEMNDFMQQYKNASSAELNEMRLAFNSSLKVCLDIWGDSIFYKPNGDNWRTQMISPLFDAQMLAVYLLTKNQQEMAIQRRDIVVTKSRALYNENIEYKNAVDRATGNPGNIFKRINLLHTLIISVLEE